MRSWLAFFVLVLALATLAGCVQPRIGSLEYSDPYGNTANNPDRNWWDRESAPGELDVDKFLWRWRGLTE